jgi:hypothetical protein
MSELRLIRGARITQQLNEDSTEDKLDQNIRTSFPDTKKRHNATNEVVISNIQYIPYIGTKFLHIKSTSQSNSHSYNQVLQFTKVNFENVDSPENITFTSSDNGTDCHVQPIQLSEHNCKVKCNCLDFYYRFAPHNAGDNSLVGKAPPLYQRRTTTRPSVNPTRVPGLCKHLLKLVQSLQGTGLVQ